MNTSSIKTIRLLIVDDHEVVRIGLKTLLARYPQISVVGETATVAQTLQELPKLKPDLILLDLRLPDGSGFKVCEQMDQLSPDTRVLVLTSVADDQTVIGALDAGVDGYLLKEIDGEGLVKAIETVAAGNSILDPVVTKRVLSRVRAGGEPPKEDKFSLLSPQERRVIALVAEGKTNKEIGVAMGLSEKTVKNYLSNLLDKLQFSRRSQAAAFYVQHAHV